jgi:predicted transcriptional regulator
MAVTLSASVDDQMALKVRSVAEKEHRSISNVVSSALAVFTGLPKDVRDTLLELQSQQDANGIKRLSREMMAAMSRIRLEAATQRLTDETIFGGPDTSADDIDLLEEATRLGEAAKHAKPHP